MSASAVAGVDDEREVGEAGGADVAAERFLLLVAGGFLVEVVEAGLADGDDFGMAAQGDDGVGFGERVFADAVGVDADGAPDPVPALHELDELAGLAHAGPDGDHLGDAVRRGPGDQVVAVGGFEHVEMTVRVDKHQIGRIRRLARRSGGRCLAVRGAGCRREADDRGRRAGVGRGARRAGRACGTCCRV